MGFSYLGRGVSLHGCSSKAQPLLLTLDEGYLLIAAVPDLQHGIAPLGPPVPAQPPLLRLLLPAIGPGLGRGWLLPAAATGFGSGGSSGSPPLSSGHRTGKDQFSFQSQRKAMPKNAQTTAQLHTSHMLVK